MQGYAFSVFCLTILFILRSELAIRWIRKAVRANYRRLDNVWRTNHFDPQLDQWVVRQSYRRITDKYWVLIFNLGVWSYKKAFPELPLPLFPI